MQFAIPLSRYPWSHARELKPNLDEMIEEMLRQRVRLIAIVGDDCAGMEDVVDELIVGDGSDKSRFSVTTSHPDEPLEDVLHFARNFHVFYLEDDTEEELFGEPTVIEI